VRDSSPTDYRLSYFEVGGVVEGLAQFVQQYGYLYVRFEIHENEVGLIGIGRVYKTSYTLPPENVSLATS